MTRSLKILGLALVAAMAMSVVAASAAQAAPEFTPFNTKTNKHEAGTFTASGLGVQRFKATSSSSLSLECTELHATGSFTGPSSEQTVENIVYSGGGAGGACHTNPLNLNVHVRMNECHYRFHVTAAIVAEMEYSGSAEIVCPEGKEIEVEVTTTSGTRKCLDKIPTQANAGNVRYVNNTGTPPTDITVVSEATNVMNTTVGNALNCGVAEGTHNTGEYAGEATVTAKNTLEEPIDLTVMG